MVFSVLRVDNLKKNAIPSGIRKFFSNGGARPKDIHLILDEKGFHIGSAFLVFDKKEEAESGLKLDGEDFMGQKLEVRNSNETEFSKVMPDDVPLLTKWSRSSQSQASRERDERSDLHSYLVKVENIDLTAKFGDLRKFFKDSGARPEDIHLVIGTDGKHNGTAFLVFTHHYEMVQGIRSDGKLFMDKRLKVSRTTVEEFREIFPRKPLLTNRPVYERRYEPYHRRSMHHEEDARLMDRREYRRSIPSLMEPRSSAALPDISGFSRATVSNPEVQELLQILKTTVNNLAGVAASLGNNESRSHTSRNPRFDDEREPYFFGRY